MNLSEYDENRNENDGNKEATTYFSQMMFGDKQGDLRTGLWQDFCNVLILLSFKSIIEAKQAEGKEAAEAVILEWRNRAMGLMSDQINKYAEMKRTSIGKILGESIPDEENVKMKFIEAVREVEDMARKVLLSPPGNATT